MDKETQVEETQVEETTVQDKINEVAEEDKAEKTEKLSLKSLQAKIDGMQKTEEEIEAEVEKRVTARIEAMEDRDFRPVKGRVAGTKIRVMTPDEYKAYSAENGLIMGRKPNEKTKCGIEELRSIINSNWTPGMVMEKHGLNAEDLKQVVWKLSNSELRERAIKYSIERDNFSREG